MESRSSSQGPLGPQHTSFDELPWTAVQVLAAAVVRSGDVDLIRTARLVCKGWRSAIMANVTGAVLRPLSRKGLDVDGKGLPIARVKGRARYFSRTDALLESSYCVDVPDPVAVKGRGPSVAEAEAEEARATQLWARLLEERGIPAVRSAGGRGAQLQRDSVGFWPASDASGDEWDSGLEGEGDEDEDEGEEGSVAGGAAAGAPSAGAGAANAAHAAGRGGAGGGASRASGKSHSRGRGLFAFRRHGVHGAADGGPGAPAPGDRGQAGVVVSNAELDKFSAALRGQFVPGDEALPRVVLRMERGPSAPPDTRAAAVGRLDGAQGRRDRGHPSAAAAVRGPGVHTGAAERERQGAAVLDEEEMLARLRAVLDADSGASSSNVAPPLRQGPTALGFPTDRDKFLGGPPEAALPPVLRTAVVSAVHLPLRSAPVSLGPVLELRDLQELSVSVAAHKLDGGELASLTRLTYLRLRLHRRDPLKIMCLASKARLPPLSFHLGVWQAVTQLTKLKKLSLADSTGITASHIVKLTALEGLVSLDLTGVKLPISALNAFPLMQGLTQLRIPKVSIVQEDFMQMMGDAPTCPKLVQMIEAMPSLRHLDVYWAGKGDGQSIVKDLKHMRTLARATQLRRLDIAKLQQVSDTALRCLSTLTGLTALKLGCNTWDLYRLRGQAFTMFKDFPHLRLLYLEALQQLTADAYLAIASACPRLEHLHVDSASAITPYAFAATRLLTSLEVLELVGMTRVPNSVISRVVSAMPSLLPDTAANIIAYKRFSDVHLPKFGEKLPFTW